MPKRVPQPPEPPRAPQGFPEFPKSVPDSRLNKLRKTSKNMDLSNYLCKNIDKTGKNQENPGSQHLPKQKH